MQARAGGNIPLWEMKMTANNAQPMSQKQADGLRREWALLLKMGYASQWTPEQKMTRQDEIAALLQHAGQALPRALTRQELLGQAFGDPAVMQTLHQLAEYPVLSVLAATRTQATKLDGRACRYLYEAAGSALVQYEVSEKERAFMQQLGVVVPTNPREAEEVMLMSCLEVAQGVREKPCSAQQANVMRVAAMVIGRSFPASQKRLSAAAARYFEAQPGEEVESAEIVRRGWVANLPRLRDRLEHKLRMARAQ
jgi:hypothetical protein